MIFVVKVERIGLYVSFCRRMEKKGSRERIISKEKGNYLYRIWRKKGRILMIVFFICIKESFLKE